MRTRMITCDFKQAGKGLAVYLALTLMPTVLLAGLSRDDAAGIVTDNITGLMWQDNASSTGNWEGAISTCEALSLGGYDDWRLPNRNELHSITDWTRFNPAMDPVFESTVLNSYWSSTSSVADYSTAWYVDAGSGKSSTGAKSTTYYLRCVRGGM